MSEVAVTAIQAVGGALVIFFGVNGWFDRQRKLREGTTTTQVEASQKSADLMALDQVSDQWQEYAREMKEDQASLRGLLASEALARRALEERVNVLVSRDYLWRNYVLGTLHPHIESNLGPPAPPIPESLSTPL